MQVRHRIPTIFNLSMVDVLCCALGCVILLWLINLREFKLRSMAAAETGKLLASAQARLDETTRDAEETRRRLASAEQQVQDTSAQLKVARSDRDQAARRADTTQQDRDRLRLELDAALVRLAQMTKESQELKAQQAAATERLAKLTREQEDLARDRNEALQRLAALEKALREKDLVAGAASRQADDLAGRLRAAEAKLKEMRGLADLLEGARGKLSAAETRAQTLEADAAAQKRQLSDAQRLIALLEDEKKQLADRALRAQAAIDNRFAGLTLTGRRVVFLIDMSGSMDLLDERTPATDKWPIVRESVVKIMRSLQDLEKFQVILFSDQVLYPLGSPHAWLDYAPKTSPDRVLAALAAVKPRGNTNVHAGLEAAFRYRPAGLDTVYFVSDGLPNIGEGLAPEKARTMRETDRAEVLGRYIRATLKTDWNRTLPDRPRVRINALGFFYESPDVGAFLWALARENDGSFVGMSRP